MKLIQKLNRDGSSPANKGFGGLLQRKRKAELIDRKVSEYERLEEFTGMKKKVLSAMFVPFDDRIEEYLNTQPRSGLELALGEFINSIMLYDAVREDNNAGNKINRAKFIMGKTWEKVNQLIEECFTVEERKILILYKEYQNFNLYIHDSDWIIYENQEEMDIDDEDNETVDYNIYFNNLGEVSEEIRETILRETKYKYFFTEVGDTLCIVDSVFVDKVSIDREPVNLVEQQVLQSLSNNQSTNTQSNAQSGRTLEVDLGQQLIPTDHTPNTRARSNDELTGMITDLLNRQRREDME